MKSKKSYWLSFAAAIPLVAIAAQADAAEKAVAEKAAAADDNAANEDKDVIMVVAQRREEQLKDVPISVSVATADTLSQAGVSNSRELQAVIPGLRLEGVGTYIQPAIRGIYTTQTSFQEPNVSTYVDGVYQATALGAVFNLPDVKQIEVLKGPQGTLFGRNATGGAILIRTIDADLNNVTGKASIGYGSYDTVTAKGYVSIPLVQDKLSLMVTGMLEDTGGWKINLADNRSHKGASVLDRLVRVKLRFIPWEGADFTLRGTYAKRTDNSILKATPWNGNNAQDAYLVANNLVRPSKPWEFAVDQNAQVITEHKDVALTGSIEIGPGTLTTTTAYNSMRGYILTDSDLSIRPTGNNEFYQKQDNFSQELVYSTEQLGAFHGTLGAFYFSSHSRFQPGKSVSFLTGNVTTLWPVDRDKSWAIFGEANYSFTDQLILTAGLRFSHEKRRDQISFAATEPDPIPLLGETSWDSATPRVSLMYKATENVNFYVTYSEGFKSGTYNVTSAQATPVNPEKVKAWEAGMKGTLADGLNVDLAGFHYDYSNLQVTNISQTSDGRLIQSLQNAAAAKIYGAELSINWRPVDGLRILAGATWLHGRYSSFPNAVDNKPTGTGGNATFGPFDATGNRLQRSPDFSANLSVNYKIPTDVGTFDLNGSVFYSERVYHDVSNRVTQPPYATVNASLAWSPKDMDALQISAWVKNLTNHAVISSVTISAAYDAIDYIAPRRFGVDVSYKF